MEVGDLFTLKSSREAVKTIYWVKPEEPIVCGDCAGSGKPLCRRLPDCLLPNQKYVKLTKREAEKVRKSGQVILEY